MKKILIVSGVILAGLLLIAGLLAMRWAGAHNTIVNKQQGAEKAWAQVQSVYQRRADLVPNLVATVAGAANFEKSTLEAVTEARASVGKVQINASQLPTAEQMQAFQKAQDGLSSALSRLLVVTENYPTLKATDSFRDLQAQLEGTENRITVERGNFNTAVQEYNSYINSFFVPALVARFEGDKEKPYFQAAEGSDKAPVVKF